MKRFRPSATNRATLAALFVALVCACSLERSELDTVESTDASHDTHSKLDTRDIFDAATDQTESPQDVFVELLAPAGILKAVPESIDFGPQRVGMTGRRNFQLQNVGTEKVTVTSIEVSGGGGETLFGVELPQELPVVIPASNLRTIAVTYTPTKAAEFDPDTGKPITDEARLLIDSDAFVPTLEVPLSAYGAEFTCPVAVIDIEEGLAVNPETNLHLRGDESWAARGEIERWEWRVEQPIGSQSVFLPSSTFPNPTFEANVGGTYVFCLDVWDSLGEKSCESACHELAVVCVGNGIQVELLWTTQGDPDETDTGFNAGSDLNLHLMHPNAPASADAPDLDGDGAPDPYFDQPYDCYWFNPNPDWGSFGNTLHDDPRLVSDDTDGSGPEIIELYEPERNAEYRVGVHYWNDRGYGNSFATVRVYIYEELVYEESNVRLEDKDLWCVAFIDWTNRKVTACRSASGERMIAPDYRPPMFFD